jgi:FKBP-type peptidyl-prolyl cis-trans isomerase SlyD
MTQLSPQLDVRGAPWHSTRVESVLRPALVGPDQHVTISYSVFEEGHDEPWGESEGCGDPGCSSHQPAGVTQVAYVHGYGLILPALESALEGRGPEEHLSFWAEPPQAFGDYEKEGVFELEKEGLEGAETLEVGDEFVASGPDGEAVLRVIEVHPATLLVDANHPLAGKRVRFEVDVLAVRAATEEEVEEASDEAEDLYDGCGDDEHEHAPQADELIQLSGKRKS